MQKSIESRDKQALREASSKSRERLQWQQSSIPDQKILATSKTIRHEGQQMRMSTESHVSGISGILGNTIANMGASGISVANTIPVSRINNKSSERLSDEILIGCTVLQ